jgi:hypothetical protein
MYFIAAISFRVTALTTIGAGRAGQEKGGRHLLSRCVVRVALYRSAASSRDQVQGALNRQSGQPVAPVISPASLGPVLRLNARMEPRASAPRPESGTLVLIEKPAEGIPRVGIERLDRVLGHGPDRAEGAK